MGATICAEGKCLYSRAMNQEPPRRCVKCGNPEPEQKGKVIPAPTKPDNVSVKTDLSASSSKTSTKKAQKIIHFTDISKRKSSYLVELLDAHEELYLMIPNALPIKITFAKMI